MWGETQLDKYQVNKKLLIFPVKNEVNYNRNSNGNLGYKSFVLRAQNNMSVLLGILLVSKVEKLKYIWGKNLST